MNIERLENDNGEFRCFEVSNRIISRQGMATVVSSLTGVKMLHSPKFYDDEVFCVFEFMSHRFEMTEPYGDSDVFDVLGPEEAKLEIEILAKHFERSNPIRGGDSGHTAFFIVNWYVGTLILMGLIYGISVVIRQVFD